MIDAIAMFFGFGALVSTLSGTLVMMSSKSFLKKLGITLDCLSVSVVCIAVFLLMLPFSSMALIT